MQIQDKEKNYYYLAMIIFFSKVENWNGTRFRGEFYLFVIIIPNKNALDSI